MRGRDDDYVDSTKLEDDSDEMMEEQSDDSDAVSYTHLRAHET